MGSLHGFTFKKGLKEMFSQIRRSAGRIPRVRKRKSELGPFTYNIMHMSEFTYNLILITVFSYNIILITGFSYLPYEFRTDILYRRYP